MKPKKSADVLLILTGKLKLIRVNLVLGGKNVPEDIVTDTDSVIEKNDANGKAMKEANLVIGRKGKWKNLTIRRIARYFRKNQRPYF